MSNALPGVNITPVAIDQRSTKVGRRHVDINLTRHTVAAWA